MDNKKCKVCGKEEIKSREMCNICYAKWYRKTHEEQIRPVARARYLRNRDKWLANSKAWAKKHPDKIRAYGIKRWHKNNKLNRIRQLTKARFSNLKDNGFCQNCGSKDRLEFHHLEPIAPENFIILCFNCHRVLHGQLFSQFVKPQSKAVFESSHELGGNK
jgi:5-methylcytosine-specific restriction endonuclease McrA